MDLNDFINMVDDANGINHDEIEKKVTENMNKEDKPNKKDKSKKDKNFIERAFLKNEINKVEPGSVKLEGIEKIYSPLGQNITQSAGDKAFTALQALLQIRDTLGIGKVADYIKEGNSPETLKRIQDINNKNLELISKEPSKEIYKELAENTKKELSEPTDWLPDMEMRLKGAKLSNKKMKKIEDKKIDELSADNKPSNNLEIARPDSGDWGHFNDVAEGYGVLLSIAHPDMSQGQIQKAVENARLHDYGKLAVPYRDLWSKANSYDYAWGTPEKEYVMNKVANRINPHDAIGFSTLSELGNYDAAIAASEHHFKDSKNQSLDSNLLKIMDVLNALTGKRSYRDSVPLEEGLKTIKDMVDKGIVSHEAYDIVEKAIKSGKLQAPKNTKSEMTDVYKSTARKAIEDRGIKLRDVRNTSSLGNTLDIINDRLNYDKEFLMSGRPLHTMAGYIYPKISARVKKDALIDLYKKQGDIEMVAKLKGNFFDDEAIDRLFSRNTKEISNSL